MVVKGHINLAQIVTLKMDILLHIFVLYSGILRDKKSASKFKYILNYDTQKYPFCRLQLLVEALEQIYIKFSTVVEPTIKKALF